MRVHYPKLYNMACLHPLNVLLLPKDLIIIIYLYAGSVLSNYLLMHGKSGRLILVFANKRLACSSLKYYDFGGIPINLLTHLILKVSTHFLKILKHSEIISLVYDKNITCRVIIESTGF